jgi:hypothetical protein
MVLGITIDLRGAGLAHLGQRPSGPALTNLYLDTYGERIGLRSGNHNQSHKKSPTLIVIAE